MQNPTHREASLASRWPALIFFTLVGFLLTFGLTSGAAQADEKGIECEAIKRPDLETGEIQRGLAIYHKIQRLDAHGAPLSVRRSQEKIWFGTDSFKRDMAGQWCHHALTVYECRHDGSTQTSYIRGGITHTTRNWVLYKNQQFFASYYEESLYFGNDGFEKCHERIISIITNEIKNRFLN